MYEAEVGRLGFSFLRGGILNIIRALLVAALLSACGEPSDPPDAGPMDAATDSGTTRCEGDEDCDDAVYCNGAETCEPTASDADGRGCVAPSGARCLAGQTCDEDAELCVTDDCLIGGDADDDGAFSEECGGNDCDDADPSRTPDAAEVCDPRDRDEDCDLTTFGDRDADGDGYPDAACCNLIAGGSLACGSDCNDLDATAHPTEAEACDGVDNDCDGAVDEGSLLVFYRDVDGDGYGVTSMTRSGCTAALGYVLTPGDCDDTRSAVHPGASEVCNDLDDDCDTMVDPPPCMCTMGVPPRSCGESDGAGGFLMVGACHPGLQDCVTGTWGVCSGDVRPGAESCNSADDDCDGATDEGVLSTYYRDLDGDGYGDATMMMLACAAPPGYVVLSGDCDDTMPSVRPTGVEACNGLDDNCSGVVDEGVLLVFYRDVDGDGYGSATTTSACTAPAGFVSMPGDCNDANDAIRPGVADGPPSTCDLLDNNCDGNVDSGCGCANGSMQACGTSDGMGGFLNRGICRPGIQTCSGGTWGACAGSVSPVPETCNLLDDDCDGVTDDGALTSYYRDCDGDGYGATGSIASTGCMPPGTPPTCGAGTGVWVANNGDCQDGIIAIHAGATETCNNIDDNCDMVVDGMPANTWCNTPSMPVNTTGPAVCASSTMSCTYSCAGAYLDCNSTTFGCETNGALTTNCGECGHACRSSSSACLAGLCTHDFEEIEAGTNRTCGLQHDGSVWCWGQNYGSTPVRVPGITDAVDSLSVGDDEVCVLRGSSNALRCWGGSYGAYPGSGGGAAASALAEVSVGRTHACARSYYAGGEGVYCWAHGSSTTPGLIAGLATATDIAVGATYGCAILSDPPGSLETIVCWPLGSSSTPTLTPIGAAVDVSDITAGAETFCTAGTEMCWQGLGTGLAMITCDELAVGPDDSVCHRSLDTGTPDPTDVRLRCSATYSGFSTVATVPGSVREIVRGNGHGCIRVAAGSGDKVSCWGTNTFGQVGDGTTITRPTPVDVGG